MLQHTFYNTLLATTKIHLFQHRKVRTSVELIAHRNCILPKLTNKPCNNRINIKHTLSQNCYLHMSLNLSQVSMWMSKLQHTIFCWSTYTCSGQFQCILGWNGYTHINIRFPKEIYHKLCSQQCHLVNMLI